jgi:hypothetical protein
VPAYRAEATIGRCIDALLAAGFASDEIVVIDDGSPDATVAVARERGVEPLVLQGNGGAAAARNAGVARARGEILFFVDADVMVHDDVRERVEAFFRGHPDHAGVFGSYDAASPTPSRVSRIRNLLHHHVHQLSPGPASTFWTGCGALRRADFEAVGGFRVEDRMLEDVALGLRLVRAGHPIVLDPDLQCTHLKAWTWAGLARTDYRDRAVPWTRLMTDPANRDLAHVLNVGNRGKASVAAVGTSLLAVPLMLWSPAAGLMLALAALVALALLERRFLALVFRVGGAAEAAAAVAVLWVHYLAAGAGYARVRLLG